MKVVKKFYRGIDFLAKGGLYFSSAIIFFMTFTTFFDASARRFFNSPIAGVIELNEVLLVFTIFFAMGWTQIIHEHIQVEILYERFSKKTQSILIIITSSISLLLVGALAYQSSLAAWEAYITQDFQVGSIKYPLWPGKAAVPIGSLILCLQLLREVIDGFIFFTSKEKRDKGD
jgi:TRAP-type mannitol/chloroaromatic compound transport system permease small subunit